MLFFFPRGVLDEILNLIESVSEGFPSYFCMNRVFLFNFKDGLYWLSLGVQRKSLGSILLFPKSLPPCTTPCFFFSLWYFLWEVVGIFILTICWLTSESSLAVLQRHDILAANFESQKQATLQTIYQPNQNNYTHRASTLAISKYLKNIKHILIPIFHFSY